MPLTVTRSQSATTQRTWMLRDPQRSMQRVGLAISSSHSLRRPEQLPEIRKPKHGASMQRSEMSDAEVWPPYDAEAVLAGPFVLRAGPGRDLIARSDRQSVLPQWIPLSRAHPRCIADVCTSTSASKTCPALRRRRRILLTVKSVSVAGCAQRRWTAEEVRGHWSAVICTRSQSWPEVQRGGTHASAPAGVEQQCCDAGAAADVVRSSPTSSSRTQLSSSTISTAGPSWRSDRPRSMAGRSPGRLTADPPDTARPRSSSRAARRASEATR